MFAVFLPTRPVKLSDLLVKLYELPNTDVNRESSKSSQVFLRRGMAYEKQQIVDWVFHHFGKRWASECDVAFSNHPISCHIATEKGLILGFACYDSNCRGMFGPIGVIQRARGQGVGRGLLLSSLRAMAALGYAYAVIGGVRSPEFYKRVVSVTEIPCSTPGIYADELAK